MTVDVQAPPGAGPPVRRARLRFGAAVWRRPWLKGVGLLGPPAVAFGVVYLGALAVLLVSSLWTVNSFTGQLVHQWTLDNYRIIFSLSDPTYLRIAGRTIGIAAAVTITDAVLAFPLAYFMARVAPSRLRGLLFVAVVLPLWSSYLVRIYAWQTILSGGGALDWSLGKLGLPAANIAYSNWAMWLVFTYVWLPFMVLPVYGSLERIPHSYIEASRDLGARGIADAPLRHPPARAARDRRRVDLHLLADARRLHHAAPDRRHQFDLHRERRLREHRHQCEHPVRGRPRDDPRRRDGRVPRDRAPARRLRRLVMETRTTRIGLWIWTALVVAFLWAPLVLIGVYAFNKSNVQSWPIPGWTTHWFRVAWSDPDVRNSLRLSVEVGLIATTIALALGSMAAFAIHRFRFFGRESVSFLLILPIALPGIITGMALNSFYVFAGIGFSIWTIVIGHATFCVVVVYNNVLARLRRTAPSLYEASMDLGADGWQTFRYVTWPVLSTALISGALLAFALSFDEVIVTTFTAGAQTTLPIFILDNLRQGQQLPIVNVVALVVIVLTIIPVAVAQHLTRETGILRTE